MDKRIARGRYTGDTYGYRTASERSVFLVRCSLVRSICVYVLKNLWNSSISVTRVTKVKSGNDKSHHMHIACMSYNRDYNLSSFPY